MIGTQVERFRIAGPVSDSATLIASIEAAIRLTAISPDYVTGFRIDEAGHLVFCSQTSKRQTHYPFPASVNTIAEHITHYITSISEDDLSKFGEGVTGHEEEYEIGFELYIDDWRSDHCKVADASFSDVFAVKPAKIEWGK